MQVLKGEKVDGAFGSGKTLNSGANDNIFVYFADHGAKVPQRNLVPLSLLL